jgi:putative two-component system response regulator
MAASIARSHHEHWDGSGYPDGLAGEAIPIAARIVAVADVYDALTSKRPYREALSDPEAIAKIDAGIGTQFDPKVVAALHRWRELAPLADAIDSIEQSASV